VQIQEDKLEETAEILGISAIKYFDYKRDRTSDYVFAFDSMLDPNGNTGVYLLYMYVRICSIMRKGNYNEETIAKLLAEGHSFKIGDPSERNLALTLLKLPEQIDMMVADLQPNKLCDLIYDISVKFGEFYGKVKVLNDPEHEVSRILLLDATKKVMKTIFDLLGMKTIERI